MKTIIALALFASSGVAVAGGSQTAETRGTISGFAWETTGTCSYKCDEKSATATADGDVVKAAKGG